MIGRWKMSKNPNKPILVPPRDLSLVEKVDLAKKAISRIYGDNSVPREIVMEKLEQIEVFVENSINNIMNQNIREAINNVGKDGN
jgi:hypothetical protein